MMEQIRIKVLDFTENPGPRYIRQDKIGESNSGEAFYLQKLNGVFAQAFKENKTASDRARRSIWISFIFS